MITSENGSVVGRLSARLSEIPTGFLGALVAIPIIPLFVGFGIGSEVLILGLFALSYNLMFGLTGLLSFGHALFYGLGAYLTASIVIEMGLPLVPTLLAVMVVIGALSFLVGLISLRLSGIAFAMVTLAFAQLGYELVLEFNGLTGGADGLLGIYRPSPFGFGVVDITSEVVFYAFCGVVTLIFVGYTYVLSRSLFGRTLAAIRINDERTQALGVDTYRVKVVVFTLAGAIGAVAGGLWSMYIRYISPTILFWSQTGDAILYTLIGGMHSVTGPILGAGFLRTSDRLLFQTESGLYSIAVGTVFVLIVLFKRGGFVSIIEDVRSYILHVSPLQSSDEETETVSRED
jgi:branched-chain amino acid transport system permease protein